MRGMRPLMVALAIGLMMGCDRGGDPEQAAASNPDFRVDLEQVRYERRGIFPFDLLIGRAYVTSAKPLPSNETWYPDPARTALRVFEDGVERPVLRLTPFAKAEGKPNLLVLVPLTQALAVGPGGGAAFDPQLTRTLQRIADGYEQDYYNLAMVLCWGSTERRYAFSDETAADARADLGELTLPGPPQGSYMDCLEPALADLDWLQRADPEAAAEAARQRGTLPLFFEGNQDKRTEVLLLTDGLPFREGPLDRMSDLLVQGNFPLYTIGLDVNTQGERGLARLDELYRRRRLGGALTRVESHEGLEKALTGIVDSWLDPGISYMAEYVSGYSGPRSNELSVWVSWRDGQYTSREIRTVPGGFSGNLRWGLRALILVGGLAFGLYVLYRRQIWPFRVKHSLVPCPEGCGHLIPQRWPTCRFCELRGAWGRLILLNGDRAGEIIYLKGEHYTLGASPDDDVVLTHLKDFKIERAHVHLHRLEEGEKLALEVDAPGVVIDQRSIPVGEVINLRFGDILRFGEKGLATILLRGVGRLD